MVCFGVGSREQVRSEYISMIENAGSKVTGKETIDQLKKIYKKTVERNNGK